ncbi:MAG: MarR family transcriptional regulator [Sneathiella sp.]|jgi:DNA-binding MarR family transcriptional regulator|nr:MarR family transcriptional regulator [Sneathiella sp.]
MDYASLVDFTMPDISIKGPMTKRKLILANFTPYRVSRLDNEISAVFQRMYASVFKLSVPQWRMLAASHQLQPTTVSELTQYSAMEKMTVARAITDLESNGLVSRSVDKEDRRRTLIKLTGRGAEVYDQISELGLQFEDELLSVLSEEEIERFKDITSRLVDKIALMRNGSEAIFAEPRR